MLHEFDLKYTRNYATEAKARAAAAKVHPITVNPARRELKQFAKEGYEL
jgi:hypothetical protein